MKRSGWLVAVVVALLSLTAGGGLRAADTLASAPGGSFTLVDHRGRAVTDGDFRGKFLLVFFGYTHCIDVCPTTLFEIAMVMERLGPSSRKVKPLFITVDPERDTPEVMAEYVDAFDAGIIGLSGTREEILRVATAYKVHYAKPSHETRSEPHGHEHAHYGEHHASYNVEHSPFIYFMGPTGEYVSHFAPRTSLEGMVRTIRDAIERLAPNLAERPPR